MDLATMAINDLKAIAYDTLAQIEYQQNALRIINQEIQKRQNVPPVDLTPTTDAPPDA